MTQPSNEPAPPIGYPPHQFPGAATHHLPVQGQESAPAAAAPSPFAGITVRDYILDATSALLLIISLFMTWSITPGNPVDAAAASHIAVLLITIVSLLSLGLTYLWRAGAFGPSWNYRKMQDLRILANVPYIVLVLVYLVIIIAKDGVLREAAAFGLAGAILAAQPRKSEMGVLPESSTRTRRWLYILWGVAGASAIIAFVQLLKTLIGMNGLLSGWGIVAAIVGGAVTPFLLLLITKRIHAGSQVHRLAAIGLGIAGAFLAFVSLADGPQAAVFVSGGFIQFSPFLWMAFGAVAMAPTLDSQMQPIAPLDKWRQTHHVVLHMTIVLAACSVIFSVVNLIENRSAYDGTETALYVMTLIFSVLVGVGAIVVKQAFAGNIAQGYMLSSVYAGIVFVLFLVLVIMASSNQSWSGWLFGLLLLINFIIPAALMLLLWAPAASRAEYASLKGTPGVHAGFSFEGTPKPTTAHAYPTAAPSAAQLMAEAANPATPAGRLHELALNHPQTQAAIIANPSTYEELRNWLIQVRDDALTKEQVDAQADTSETATDSAGSVPTVHETSKETEASPAESVEEPEANSDSELDVATIGNQESVEVVSAESTSVESVPAEIKNVVLEPEIDESAVNSAMTESVPPFDPLAAEASHPGTSGARLQELAGNYPYLHGAILANPAAYEGLRAWISAQQPGQTSAVLDPLVSEASNPRTTGTRLQELAANHQYLHAVIAANPSAYPQLLQWLAQVNAPGVTEALSQR